MFPQGNEIGQLDAAGQPIRSVSRGRSLGLGKWIFHIYLHCRRGSSLRSPSKFTFPPLLYNGMLIISPQPIVSKSRHHLRSPPLSLLSDHPLSLPFISTPPFLSLTDTPSLSLPSQHLPQHLPSFPPSPSPFPSPSLSPFPSQPPLPNPHIHTPQPPPPLPPKPTFSPLYHLLHQHRRPISISPSLPHRVTRHSTHSSFTCLSILPSQGPSFFLSFFSLMPR